ncbi:hypothetical protein [Actinomycetospora straminea]|uniref:Uncharacterized protein n=1 Tax=Actinomycetospora straminea TaxID=663607 RepID=A0ABP9E0W3_9PSEU|nr:hypothetical protein [Actinomycetospora straminea]MDD7930983.1 hypothetical protein [Actinomycetospora straminea]
MGVLAAVGAIGVGAGAWMVTPLVSMARRGTLEQQAAAAMREEAQRVASVQRARRRAALVATIPTQRTAAPVTRRSPIAS